MNRRVYGLRAWMHQRLSALYMVFFLAYIIVHFVTSPAVNYELWHAWLASPITNLIFALFFLSLLIHAWIGMRDVIIDYVHVISLRLIALLAIGLVLIATGLWVLKILFSVV